MRIGCLFLLAIASSCWEIGMAVEHPNRIVAVWGRTGILLHDIYYDGKWIGSRTTHQQAIAEYHSYARARSKDTTDRRRTVVRE
jgi:hypothetical protein